RFACHPSANSWHNLAMATDDIGSGYLRNRLVRALLLACVAHGCIRSEGGEPQFRNTPCVGDPSTCSPAVTGRQVSRHEAPTQQAPAPTPAFVRRPAAPGPLPTFALNPGGSRLPRGPTYFSRRGYRRSFPTNPWFRP